MGQQIKFCCSNNIRKKNAITKRFFTAANRVVAVTKYICDPTFNELFCWGNKILFFGERLVRALGVNESC